MNVRPFKVGLQTEQYPLEIKRNETFEVLSDESEDEDIPIPARPRPTAVDTGISLRRLADQS